MLPMSALSRRAVVAAAAVAAAAPNAAARKRKRKRAPQPQPEPLAFLAIAIQDVTLNPTFATFVWGYDAQLRHPESGFTRDLTDTVTQVNSDASQAETREAIVSGARSLARTFLLQAGHDVPEDRIAVVLL